MLIHRVLLSPDRMANGTNHTDEIRLWREDDWWIATDIETGVTTQGPSRVAALENLDEAIALYKDEIGREPSDKELQEMGIDLVDNTADKTRLSG